MSSPDFDSAFQKATEHEAGFSHAAHVQVAWRLLDALPVLEALARFRCGLQALTRRHGQPEKYHETRTIAFMFLILERRTQQSTGTWEEFAAQHADLLVAGRSDAMLELYYPATVLASDEARTYFVVPPY
jgi:hypothetical protein